MEGILLDPTLQILVQAIAPVAATPLRVDGLVMRNGKPEYFASDIIVETYIGATTQLLVPCYSDYLISLSAHVPADIGPDQSVYVDIAIVHGNVNMQRKVASIGSGWVYNSNPIGFPSSNRINDRTCLAPVMSIAPVVAPGAEVIYVPLVGLNCDLVGFSGTLTCAAGGAARNAGLEVLDSAGNTIMRCMNSTLLAPGSISTLYYSGNVPVDLTIGTDLYVGGINVPARDPMTFQTITNNLAVGDSWANSTFFLRPNIIL